MWYREISSGNLLWIFDWNKINYGGNFREKLLYVID